MDLGLNEALKLIDYARYEAEKLGVPMVIAVVDIGGNLIAEVRMDGALLVSVDIALNKAYTAVALKMPTSKLSELCQPGQSLYGIQHCNPCRIVVFGGGYPIEINGKLVGGLGVSGGSVEEDMKVAEGALKAFYESCKKAEFCT